MRTKAIIDEIYRKEKRYVKQYVREDYIANYNSIFDLGKSKNIHLETQGDLKGGKLDTHSSNYQSQQNMNRSSLNSNSQGRFFNIVQP
jgi:hypothetical protein